MPIKSTSFLNFASYFREETSQAHKQAVTWCQLTVLPFSYFDSYFRDGNSKVHRQVATWRQLGLVKIQVWVDWVMKKSNIRIKISYLYQVQIINHTLWPELDSDLNVQYPDIRVCDMIFRHCDWNSVWSNSNSIF